jgi:Rieske Fe-S protein
MCPADEVDDAALATARIKPWPRRRLLAQLFWIAVGAVSAGLAAPILIYLIRPLLGASRTADWVPMGKLADLPLNVPQRLEVARRVVEGWVTEDSQVIAWAVRLADKLYIFDAHCTHLGCAYHWHAETKEFFCPCHNGVFDLTGRVVSGPPPRPLDTYAYEVREGVVYAVPNPIKRVA